MSKFLNLKKNPNKVEKYLFHQHKVLQNIDINSVSDPQRLLTIIDNNRTRCITNNENVFNGNNSKQEFSTDKKRKDKSNITSEVHFKIKRTKRLLKQNTTKNFNICANKTFNKKSDVQQLSQITLNPQFVDEYKQDIYNHYLECEKLYLPNKNFMDNIQYDLSEQMRIILFDWLFQVHYSLKLKEETLFLTFNIIDRFLSVYAISRTQYQLLAISALLVASKYEEIYPPELNTLIKLTDNAYNKQDALLMENLILKILNFNITVISSFNFLQIYSSFFNLDKKFYYFCLYLLELACTQYNMIHFSPSVLSASAVVISFANFGYNKNHIKYFLDFCRFDFNLLIPCIQLFYSALQSISKEKYNSVYNKFLSEKFNSVARINNSDNFNIFIFEDL